MKKVLIVGGSGMVASRFVDLVKDKFEITSVDEKIIDITDTEAVKEFFDKNRFDSIINFAAYTNVDAAEAQKEDKEGLAWRLNVEGVKNLIGVCKTNNIFLIQISTDFVFPGTEISPGPYAEDAKLPERPDDIGWYGWTKNRAEMEIYSSGVNGAVVRYGYPFRADQYDLKKDWARNLISLYNEHKLYPLFADQVQSIIFVDDLTDPLLKIIGNELTGIFHLASSDTTTPYESGKYLLEKYTGGGVDIQKGSMVEFLKTPGRTPRPRLGGLKTSKTENRLEMKFKSWREMVDEFASELRS